MATRLLGMPEARERFAAARVARLATTTRDGNPHLVPVVFALVGDTMRDTMRDSERDTMRDTVWSAVDRKPKSTRALRRLDNIRANPRVSLLVDHYADDWTTLWWVRADGDALVVEAETAEAGHALSALAAKYPQYRGKPPFGPYLAVHVTHWAAWSAS